MSNHLDLLMQYQILSLLFLLSTSAFSRPIQVFRKNPICFDGVDLKGGGWIDKSVKIEGLSLKQNINAKLIKIIKTDAVFIDEQVSVDKNTVIENGVWILKGSLIGQGCRIGAESLISSNVKIGDFVEISHSVSLGFGVQIADHSIIFDHCTLQGQHENQTHVGCHTTLYQYVKIGIDCNIGDRVSIGDRAYIGSSCKLDHHCHIGKLSKIEDHCEIKEHAQVQRHVCLDHHCRLSPRATVEDNVHLPPHTTIHSKEHAVLDTNSQGWNINSSEALRNRIIHLRRKLRHMQQKDVKQFENDDVPIVFSPPYSEVDKVPETAHERYGYTVPAAILLEDDSPEFEI